MLTVIQIVRSYHLILHVSHTILICDLGKPFDPEQRHILVAEGMWW